MIVFSQSFCVKVQGNESHEFFFTVNSVFKRYLWGILLKLCILVYNLEITTICRNFNFTENFALFGVNPF